MVDVNVTEFEIEVTTRQGHVVRADVYLPRKQAGPYPVLLAASPYQKALRHLPAVPQFPFIEYGPMQLYLDVGERDDPQKCEQPAGRRGRALTSRFTRRRRVRRCSS